MSFRTRKESFRVNFRAVGVIGHELSAYEFNSNHQPVTPLIHARKVNSNKITDAISQTLDSTCNMGHQTLGNEENSNKSTFWGHLAHE